MGFLKSILTVGAGGVIAQVLTVVTMPILTRLYAPIAFAGWALFMSVAVIFASVATLRYELAVVLPATHEEGLNVLATSLLATLAVAFLALLFVPLIGPWLLGEWLTGELRGWLWWLPVYVSACGVYAAGAYWLVRTEAFTWYAVSQTALPLCTLTGQFTAALLGVNNSSGLIIGSLAGQGAVTAFMILVLKKRISPGLFKSLSWSAIYRSLRLYRMYPLYMTPYTLMGALRDRVVYFILGRFGTKVEAGYYSLSSRLVNMPNSLVSSALRPVFFQRAAVSGFASLEQTVAKTMRLQVIAIIPFWVLFLFHAQPLFALIFGEPWREAGLYAAILSVPAIPLLLGNWLDRAFDVLGRQRLALLLEAIFAAASVVALIAGVRLFKSTVAAVSLQAGIIAVYYCLWLVLLFRLARFPQAILVRLVFLALGLGGLTALPCWFLGNIFPGLYPFYLILILLVGIVGAYLFREWRLRRLGNRA